MLVTALSITTVPSDSMTPALVMALAPVSIVSAFEPTPSITPCNWLTSFIWPTPSCPAPTMVLSTLVRVAALVAP